MGKLVKPSVNRKYSKGCLSLGSHRLYSPVPGFMKQLRSFNKKISQCEDTSPSAFINFSFGRGPFPISLPLCSGSRCPLAYLHTFILKCLHTCIHIIEKTSNSYRNNAIEKLACHCIDQQQIEKQCW